jgi:uncharacterized protein
MIQFKPSRYIHISSDEDIIANRSIVYATRTGVAIELPNKFITAFSASEWEKIPDNILMELIKIGAIVPHDEVELNSVIDLNIASNKDRDKEQLSYTIQPSANCQLGCHYCGQSHVKKVLNESTTDLIFTRLVNQIEKSRDTLKKLHINWYGGEPLTGLSGIRSLSPKVLSLAKLYKLDYTAHIVTNALNLKLDLFEELVTVHKITSFQITIDGTEEFHDKRRMLKNNNPSFDIIFKNVQAIIKSDFFRQSGSAIAIRMNVDAENKENVMDLMDMFHKHEMLDKISFYISPVHDWGDNEASKVNGISKQDFADFEIEFMMALMNYGQLSTQKLVPPRNASPCMVVSETSEVIDAYGNVSTCWEVPYTPAYDNTPFVTGNINLDPGISTKDAPMRNWFKEIPTNESWCKSCKFLPVCGGACPKDWYQGSPACPSFKFNIDDRLFLKKHLTSLQ